MRRDGLLQILLSSRGYCARLDTTPCRRTEKSMKDTLEFGIFLAVLIAFVVIGCLATRAPKKTSNTGPMKH